MSKIHANPDDLRKFASDLQKFTDDLESMKSDIERKFKNIEWSDSVYRKFEEQFTSTMTILKRFIKDQPQYVQLLKSKASILEEYRRS